jgi:integration host factor subunit beta
MATTTKKTLTNQIADELDLKQMLVRDVVQAFLDGCVEELRKGNRLEFRDFGVFETVSRAARKARNPKTGEVVQVPPKIVVDFKMGKRMKTLVNQGPPEEEPEEEPQQPQPSAPPPPQQAEPSSAAQPQPTPPNPATPPQAPDEPPTGPSAPPWSNPPSETE